MIVVEKDGNGGCICVSEPNDYTRETMPLLREEHFFATVYLPRLLFQCRNLMGLLKCIQNNNESDNNHNMKPFISLLKKDANYCGKRKHVNQLRNICYVTTLVQLLEFNFHKHDQALLCKSIYCRHYSHN